MGHHHGHHHHHCEEEYNESCDPCAPRTTYVRQQYSSHSAYQPNHYGSSHMSGYHMTHYGQPSGYPHGNYPAGAYTSGPPPPSGYPGQPGQYHPPGAGPYPPPGGSFRQGAPPPPSGYPAGNYPKSGYPQQGSPPLSGAYSKPAPASGSAYPQEELSRSSPKPSSVSKHQESANFPQPPPNAYLQSPQGPSQPAGPLPYPTNQSALFPTPGAVPPGLTGAPKAPYPNQYPQSERKTPPPPPYSE